jgi:dipeptidyl aminopeptidase/acylaminoacyl peptidase
MLRRLFLLAIMAMTARSEAQVKPPAIVTEEVPPIPDALVQRYARYRRIVGAEFGGWFGGRREMLLLTGSRMGATTQVFCVVSPGDAMHQMMDAGERIRRTSPRPGHNQFVFEHDTRGNEVYRLALFDAPTGRVTRMGTGRGREENARWSHSGKSLAFTSDARNGNDRDLYVTVLASREPARRVLEVAGRVLEFDWAHSDTRLAAVIVDTRGGIRVVLVDAGSGKTDEVAFTGIPLATPDGTVLRWSGDDRALYWTTSAGAEFRRLVRHDLESGKTERAGESIPGDVEFVDLTQDGRTIALVSNIEGASRIDRFDALTGRVLPGPKLRAGRVFACAFRPDSEELAFQFESARAPSQVYSWIPSIRRVITWTHGDPEGLRFGPAADPEVVRIKSFDGRSVPAFVYWPVKKFVGPRPVLIDIHGGPRAQFRPGFLGGTNYLLEELGIVLVYPNVRGSSGYGRTYESLDDGARRGDAVSDIGAVIDWIGSQPDLDASRVALSGGSYGGYMVLASLVRFGEHVCAGISRSGISNLVTLIESQTGLVRDAVRAEFGDERDPVTRAMLSDLSPLSHVDQIRVPLLIVHGTNDARVPVRESEQILDAVRRNGQPAWSVFANNEGHEFSRRENTDYERYVELLFLERFLVGSRRAK